MEAFVSALVNATLSVGVSAAVNSFVGIAVNSVLAPLVVGLWVSL